MTNQTSPTPAEPPETIPCSVANEQAGVAPDAVAERAEQLDERLFPAILYSLLQGSVEGLDPPVYKAYVERLLSRSGSPRDPIEKMLVEQLIIAHQHGCMMMAKATKTKSPKESALLSTAASRVQAEIRRTALALANYRQMAVGRSLKVVSSDGEQNDQVNTSAG